MEEYKRFSFIQIRTTVTGLIAINIIILPVWIATGTPDIFSKISFYAQVISLAALAFELLYAQMKEIYIDSNKTQFLAKTNRRIGIIFACVGLTAAIWHASWITGVIFLVFGFYCWQVYMHVFADTNKYLEEEAKKQDANR